MASVRNGFGDLEGNLRPWIVANICFQNWELGVQSVADIWTMLGFSGEWHDQLVLLQIRWQDGALRVAEWLRGREDCVDLVYGAFIKV